MTTKRSASPLPQEQSKRLKHEWMEGIKVAVQWYRNVREEDVRLSLALCAILARAPPEAHLRTAPLPPDALILIQANPDLRKALDDTIDSWDYEDLLSLPILRTASDDVQMTPSRSHSSTSAYNAEVSATFMAFGFPYVAAFPRALLDTVDSYYSPIRYNNSISIVQSSGTGKSRGVAETAKVRFSFLFNLRRHTPHFAYPPPDAAVRDYLLSPAVSTFIRYSAFLCSLFENAPAFMLQVPCTNEPFALSWQKYMNDGEDEHRLGPRRNEFYAAVVDAAQKIERDLQRERVGESTSEQTERDNARRKKLSERLEDACKELITLLREKYENKQHPPVACLLVFDEAQELTARGSSKDGSNYHRLGSVLKEIVKSAVFSVFLSTNSNVRSLAPSVQGHPSHRVSSNPHTKLCPPFTELPFDVFAVNLYDELAVRNEGSLIAICSVPVMAHFGRALWHSLYEHRYRPIIKLAREKLNPTLDLVHDERGLFACLAIRIGLDIDASREIGRIREAELVASYMRIVFAVPEHREYMRTGTPSEPILAEAAAQLLNDQPKWKLEEQAPNFLCDAFQQGFLARGERGEMVGRLLWTLAHDAVVQSGKTYQAEPNHESDAEIRFHKPIRVLDFLHALFHEDHWETIDNATPIEDANGERLADAFSDAYISFSHFMDAVDYDMDLRKIYRLLLRGAALSCQRNQPSIDFLMPVHFGSPNLPLRRSTTSVLQAQIKNADEKEKFFVDPTLVGTTHPVLSLVHHLGTSTNSVEVTRELGIGQKSHPCHYQINSHGCTSSIFGIIPNSLDAIYPMLLGSNMLMDDFPRAGMAGSVSLFRQLQPCAELERALHQQSEKRQLEARKSGLRTGDIWSWFGHDVE